MVVAFCCFSERASWRSKWKDDRLPYNCDSTRQSCHFVRWANLSALVAASLPQAKLAIYFLPNKGKTINPNLSLEQSAFILPKEILSTRK